MKLRPSIPTTVMVVAGLLLALLPLADVFDGWDWALRVGGGVALASLIVVVMDSRWNPPLSVAVPVAGIGALVWSALVVSGAFRRDPVSRAAWFELRDGVFDGWSALMDDQVPLRDPVSAEIFVALIAWVAAAAAMHLTARRGTPLAAMGVCALVLWLVVAAALPTGLAPGLEGAFVGVAALLVVTTITWNPDDRWSPGRVISLVTMLGVAGLAATFAGEAAGTLRDDPIDPRRGRQTTVVDQSVPDLLAEYGTRLSGDGEVLSVDTVNGGVLPSLRLRLQTYDVHDGRRWLAATEYRKVATFPEPEVAPPGDLVALDVSIGELDGPWIPLLDHLVSIEIDDFRFSPDNQTALHDGDLGRYRFTGTVVDRTGLDGQPSGPETVDERFTELPESLPDTIRSTAKAAAADASDAIGELDALTLLVRELGRDDTLPPGQTLARLRDDLAAGEPTGAVQLVSLHALMARSLGHPARVVVGYTVEGQTVLPRDLHVWTEVAFPGVGWVPLDPVPPPTEAAQTVAPDQATTTTTTIPEEGVIEARALPRELGPGEDPDEAEIAESRDYTWRDVGILAAALIVLALIVLIGLRGARRRVRRTDAGVEARVLGAWAELVDRLREAGAPVTPTTTVDDIVFMAEHMDGELARPVRALGALASHALHGPTPPTDADAVQAWDRLEQAEAGLVEARGRRVIVARFLDPRALRHRAPTAPSSRR